MDPLAASVPGGSLEITTAGNPTLRAVLTLNSWHLRRGDRRAIERGIRYIWKNTSRLSDDPYETVAFELIMTLVLDSSCSWAPNDHSSATHLAHAACSPK